jgi:GTP-binding protein
MNASGPTTGWRVVSARFETSAPSLEACPAAGASEVALAGRSNVGKSSLLNALAGQRALARVGQTPGRTQLLNFFAVVLARIAEQRTLRLVDLPGWGFVGTGKSVARELAPRVEGYVAGREPLRALMLLVDARRGVDERDRQLVDFAAQRQLEVVVVATKVDKLGAAERGTLRRRIGDELGLPEALVACTSAARGEGIADAGRRPGLVSILADLAGASP